jgi:hypothetical protein
MSSGFREHLFQIAKIERFYLLIGEKPAFEKDFFWRRLPADYAFGIEIERFLSEVLQSRVTDLRRFAQGGSLRDLLVSICSHGATVVPE